MACAEIIIVHSQVIIVNTKTRIRNHCLTTLAIYKTKHKFFLAFKLKIFQITAQVQRFYLTKIHKKF